MPPERTPSGTSRSRTPGSRPTARRPRLLRPAAGRRPSQLPAPAPAEPVRRPRARLVLASPFVGVSNDTLFLLRRAAGRPIFTGLERSWPEELSADDERLLRAFKQRYERLAAASSRLSLERLCEQIWSSTTTTSRCSRTGTAAAGTRTSQAGAAGTRLRGAARARHRGLPPLHAGPGGRRGQGARGRRGGEVDAVRLLTITRQGLEFKVVIVADAGRDRPPPGPDELLALSDGRFVPGRRPDHEPPARRVRLRRGPQGEVPRIGPSGCASTTWR